jgi:ribosomal protein S18 acetylase RimI-like enzyme
VATRCTSEEGLSEPAVAIRPLAPDDERAVRTLFTYAFGNTLYAGAPRDALARALAGTTPTETAGIVAVADAQIVGVAVYGHVAGTTGAAKMHAMAVAPDSRRHGVARELIDTFVADLAARGARFVLVEFPDAEELAVGRTLLEHCDFEEESRVPDYFRDGIALCFLRLEL